MNDYGRYSNYDLSEFSHRYACWCKNHNGWAKAKRGCKKIAKKKIKRLVNKEIKEELESIITNQ